MHISKSKQQGFVLIAILGAVAFFAIVAVALQYRSQMQREQQYTSEGYSLNQVREALQKYAQANKATFQAAGTLQGVTNQYQPTIAELQVLGFLTVNGIDTTAPFGSSWATTLTLQPAGSITGMVYLNGNVTNAAGAPDQAHACNIARALKDVGVCSNPGAPAQIGNSQIQLANPTGLPASVGALIFVSA
jgi:type II secretory pathway pseudopilin PulG